MIKESYLDATYPENLKCRRSEFNGFLMNTIVGQYMALPCEFHEEWTLGNLAMEASSITQF